MTRVSLDATVGDGLPLHEIIAAPDSIEDEAPDPAEPPRVAALATLPSDVLELRALEDRAKGAEAEALRLRALYDRRAAELVDAGRYLVTAGLSVGQLRLLHARITLTQNGEPVTHHAVAKLLGV